MARGNLTRAVKLIGTEQPEGKRRVFTAGAITAMLDNGGLRYVRFQGLECKFACNSDPLRGGFRFQN